MPLRITNIQRQCVYDGPGVRTTIFLKGCHLRCPWCCNPECQSLDCDLMWDKHLCDDINETSSSRFCADCQKKGGNRLPSTCPYGAVTMVGVSYSVEELVRIILEDKTLFQTSGGGVTISGGEPLLFTDELIQLISRLKQHGVNTYVETSLFIDNDITQLASLVDGFIVDLKLQREMALECGTAYLEVVNSQLSVIRSIGKDVIYRLVFVESVIDDLDSLIDRLRVLGVKDLEILRAHSLARSKYEGLSRVFRDFSCAEDDKFNRFISCLKEDGFSVKSMSA